MNGKKNGRVGRGRHISLLVAVLVVDKMRMNCENKLKHESKLFNRQIDFPNETSLT